MSGALTPDLSNPRVGKVHFSPNWDVYGGVSRAAKIREVKLIGSTYSVRPEVLSAMEELDRMDLRYGGECISYTLEPEDGFAFGTFRWNAEVRFGRKSCVKIKSDYLLVYTDLKNQDATHTEYFFRKVGRFATYPYFRSHFSHHVSETGLLVPPLPTLHERVD